MDLETKPAAIHFNSASFWSRVWVWAVPLVALTGLVVLQASGNNIALFQLLNRLTAQVSDGWWSHLTMLGDTSLALMFILPLFGRRPNLVWQFVLAAIFAAIWSHGMKAMFSSLRPPAVLHEGSFHLIGPMLSQNSFPSGHTTTIFVLIGLCCLQRVDNRLKLLLLALAVLVGLSRIACGVHWPVDVLGGAFGGWLSAAGGVWLSQRWNAGMNIRFQRVLALLVSVVAIWSMLYYDSGFPDTRLFQFVIAAICLGLSAQWQYRLFKIG